MIRTILVDDHVVFLDALKTLLDTDRDIELVGTANNPEAGLELVKNKKVDVAVLDLRMPDSSMNGLDLAELIYNEYPTTKVVMLTMDQGGKHIARALKQKVAGFVSKGAAAVELKKAIREVSSGSTYYSPEIMKAYMDYMRHQEQEEIRLTKREREVLQLLVEEKSTQEIGKILNIGDAGVETHRRNLRGKLKVVNTAGLVREALLRNLVDLDNNRF